MGTVTVSRNTERVRPPLVSSNLAVDTLMVKVYVSSQQLIVCKSNKRCAKIVRWEWDSSLARILLLQ